MSTFDNGEISIGFEHWVERLNEWASLLALACQQIMDGFIWWICSEDQNSNSESEETAEAGGDEV